jgi:hypothetical protein
MGRKKTEFYKTDDEIFREEYNEINNSENSAVSKMNKIVLEKDRDVFIKNIIVLHDILESHRNKEIGNADTARGKNILQSLVYLILNDKFYDEIVEIRKKLGVSVESKKKYNEAEWLVRKYNLAYDFDVSKLAIILAYLIRNKLEPKKFIQIIIPMISEQRDRLLVSGLDVKVKEFPNTHKDFYKCEWKVCLSPFSIVTDFERNLKDYFIREIIHEKNEDSYNNEWVRLEMNELDINKMKYDKKAELSVIDGRDVLVLKFVTHFFTKPSEIIQLCNERYKQMRLIKKQKIDTIQKKNLSENFERNLRIFILRKYGLTYKELDSQTAIEGMDFSGLTNSFKGELGEFNRNIQNALRRKIIF